MGIRSGSESNRNTLHGAEGELVSVRIPIEPRLLEDLLGLLATASFPVNPQIYHGKPTAVEFPAYERRFPELQRLLAEAGFDTAAVEFRPMLQAIAVV